LNCFASAIKVEENLVFMRTLTLVVTTALALCTAQAWADSSIPYPYAGTVAPTNIFTATATGEVDGYFVSHGNAGAIDYLQMIDVSTSTASGWLLDNQTSTQGDEVSFGSVSAGDLLEFQIWDSNDYPGGFVFSSNPANSYDGLNHAYAAAWELGNPIDPSIPTGVYIGMEDLPSPAPPGTSWGNADFNYTDTQAVFTNVSFELATPEPGSLYLLASGLLGMAGLVRRKIRA
jgi:hypothetical protein